jgi:hypothetical protein
LRFFVRRSDAERALARLKGRKIPTIERLVPESPLAAGPLGGLQAVKGSTKSQEHFSWRTLGKMAFPGTSTSTKTRTSSYKRRRRRRRHDQRTAGGGRRRVEGYFEIYRPLQAAACAPLVTPAARTT